MEKECRPGQEKADMVPAAGSSPETEKRYKSRRDSHDRPCLGEIRRTRSREFTGRHHNCRQKPPTFLHDIPPLLTRESYHILRCELFPDD